ncbi:MAG TPA: transcription elongation factor NusA [Candidatus Aenigmarchaeota archaeon]|nr:MAG: transcription elongation factor NusA [Candidatus Aenigmarchaeota archaeon]HDD46414.1 transcription elongation factor NusA [Candidatus Aenigmarchaeota archaeon]
MKAPICDVCLTSDILCKADKEKMEKGIISESDVRVSRSIYELSKHVRPLKDITIKKVIETNNLVVIVCKEGDASKIIGKSGVIVKKLSKHLGKTVRVIEEAKDMRDFVQKLLFPTYVLGINILYTPEKEIYKIKIPKKRANINTKSLEEIIKKAFGVEAKIVPCS